MNLHIPIIRMNDALHRNRKKEPLNIITKHRILPVLLVVAIALPVVDDYPIASHRYLADPTPLVTKDRVYVYCSNDDESPVEGSYNNPNIICFSSNDMKNWTDHGSVFRSTEVTTWAQKTGLPPRSSAMGCFSSFTAGILSKANPSF